MQYNININFCFISCSTENSHFCSQYSAKVWLFLTQCTKAHPCLRTTDCWNPHQISSAIYHLRYDSCWSSCFVLVYLPECSQNRVISNQLTWPIYTFPSFTYIIFLFNVSHHSPLHKEYHSLPRFWHQFHSKTNQQTKTKDNLCSWYNIMNI